MIAGAIGLATIASQGALAEQRKLLKTQADWIDGTGQTGTMLFQGEVVDGVLTGRAYPGGGEELVVTGTVDSSGAVEGTLATTLAEEVADFTGQLNGQQELEGALTIDGEVAAEWVAPAEDLPAE